jgi:cobalamin-dependent methionine synthase I
MFDEQKLQKKIQQAEQIRNELLYQEVECQRQTNDIKIYKKYKQLIKDIKKYELERQENKRNKRVK